VLSLDPNTLGEVLGDVRTLAQATDSKDAGVALVQDAASRIDRVRLAVRAAEPVGVVALEWLDPVFVAGHWTPQLIEYAGGYDVLGMPGEHSEQRTWDEVRAAQPEVVVVMPCGYDADRALEEAETYADELATLGARRVVAVDAAAYFSRPGPRLVDGLELMAHILHPDRMPDAPGPVHEVILSLGACTPGASWLRWRPKTRCCTRGGPACRPRPRAGGTGPATRCVSSSQSSVLARSPFGATSWQRSNVRAVPAPFA
jgi:iron complex transport system substrate-binding protein